LLFKRFTKNPHDESEESIKKHLEDDVAKYVRIITSQKAGMTGPQPRAAGTTGEQPGVAGTSLGTTPVEHPDPLQKPDPPKVA
jgi:hypothetical protein